MNYSKFSGQFVCKMAMLLAFMFAACSETDSGNNVAGGTVEETGVYAMAGRIGNVYPSMLSARTSSGQEISWSAENDVTVKKGSVVTLFELDSVTLDTTGNYVIDTVLSDDGKFSFENIAFHSPYVLVSVLESCGSIECGREELKYYRSDIYFSDDYDQIEYSRMLSAVIDLRKSENVSINILTHMKSPVVRGLVASGSSFDEANVEAERLVLENYGIYKKLGRFESLDSAENEELAFVRQLVQEYAGLDTNVVPNHDNLEMLIEQYWNVPPKVYASEGKEQMYWNTIKMLKYKLGYWAKKMGHAQCTEKNEGEMFELNQYEYNSSMIVCRSGEWVPGYKSIEYTTGELVDARDGKVYKTVTYDINGKTQTWMAEDLDYTGAISASGDSLKADLLERSVCFDKKESERRTYERNSSCEASSREYRWEAAMNLDKESVRFLAVDSSSDTAYMPDTCMYSYKVMADSEAAWHAISCSSPEEDCLGNLWWDAAGTGYCAAIFEENGGLGAWNWNYAELIPEFNSSSYQGICPDGWRIPNKSDWETLRQYIVEQYGVDTARVGAVLADEVGFGFGMKDDLHPYHGDGDWMIVVPIRSYIVAPDFQDGPFAGASGVQIGDRMSYSYWPADSYYYVFDPYFVRCIKND